MMIQQRKRTFLLCILSILLISERLAFAHDSPEEKTCSAGTEGSSPSCLSPSTHNREDDSIVLPKVASQEEDLVHRIIQWMRKIVIGSNVLLSEQEKIQCLNKMAMDPNTALSKEDDNLSGEEVNPSKGEANLTKEVNANTSLSKEEDSLNKEEDNWFDDDDDDDDDEEEEEEEEEGEEEEEEYDDDDDEYDDPDAYVSIEFGVPQVVAVENEAEVRELIFYTEKYMKEVVLTNSSYEDVASECLNRDNLCSFWATHGECGEGLNESLWMKMNCAPACFSCEYLSFDMRCAFDKEAPKIWQPGDLNRMFERIVKDEYYQQFSPTVLRKPAESPDDPDDSPWVVVLDNFLTPEQCAILIQLGANQGYERSEDIGEELFSGRYDSVVVDGQTSTNAWCMEECYDHPTTKQILNKIENLTAIPDDNSEHLQLLRYEIGQFSHVHYDFIDHHNERSKGARILTILLYLNDVKAGGGTRFPELDLTVQPKQGRALLFPSVLNDQPDSNDVRTKHEALPVEKGIKYAANAWLHQRDFKTPFEAGCD